MRALRSLVLIATAVATTSCVVSSVEAFRMSPQEAAGTNVQSPLKAFLSDGRIAVFPDGASITTDSVVGYGSLYSVGLDSSDPVRMIALDDMLGLESFQGDIDVGGTILGTIGGIALVTAGGIAIACAADPKCFGSCPTIYTYDEDGQEILEAEAFSYSIAPLLEGRDVDRLGVEADEAGSVMLELRNEALETHYINHLELLEVRHDPDQEAYPNETGRILLVNGVTPPLHATDRDGSDRTRELTASDGRTFASSESRLRAVTAEDSRDHIDLVFDRPEGDTAGLVLRLRNSLLSTILFYDLMMASQGADALDWLSSGMARVGEAVELGHWFQETMGLRISVLGPDGWEQVARVPDSGPLAWEEIAVELPLSSEMDEVRVRLSFLADEWRIDFVGIAGEIEPAQARSMPISSVSLVGEAPDAVLARRLSAADEEYLVTTASAALELRSEPAGAFPADQRTFFLSSQGYYTEWIRPEWIRSAEDSGGPTQFRPSGETLVELTERWLAEKDEFQARFYETRIPVR